MSETPVNQKVLIVDDDPSVHVAIKARLKNQSLDLHSAFNGEQALLMAAEVLPDLILLDVNMPAPDGIEVCRRLKARPATGIIPVIFVTASAELDNRLDALDLGAWDYVRKPFDADALRARVKSGLRTKYVLDLLDRKGMTDTLTGLWNRGYVEQRLVAEASLARRTGRPLSLILLDVDRFRELNSAHGHPFGDEALRGVARVLTADCRTEDVACRYGSDEFAVLLPNTRADRAATLAQRLRSGVEQLRLSDRTGPVPVTVSVGVADLDDPAVATAGRGLLEAADAALYRAQSAGRNRVEGTSGGRVATLSEPS